MPSTGWLLEVASRLSAAGVWVRSFIVGVVVVLDDGTGDEAAVKEVECW